MSVTSVGPEIAIVDYGMGNLRSVLNAFRALGADVQLVSDPLLLESAGALVLPGVGAFAEAMERLDASGMRSALELNVREKGKPFLGLCLGMQLMATESVEHGRSEGLGWVEGTVLRLPSHSDNGAVRVPHVGWNDLDVVRRDGVLRQVSEKPTFYYVHSYHFEPVDDSVVSGVTTHGTRFAAVIERDNLYGTQFHPEKSQTDGLALLRSFLDVARN